MIVLLGEERKRAGSMVVCGKQYLLEITLQIGSFWKLKPVRHWQDKLRLSVGV